MRTYAGLAWDHPRGYDSLAAASAARASADDVLIHWEKQPLEGFEAHPIADLCARYDIIIMDHPHVGEAYDAGCLQPLETIFDPATLAAIAANGVGATYDSYRFAGQHWALPLDVAAQVMASRPDLMEGSAPVTWAEVAALSERTGKVAMSLAGPHTICTFMSMAHAMGDPPATADPDLFVSKTVGIEVYELLSELAGRSPAFAAGMNPIAMLGNMQVNDDIHLCPLIFAYVNYARANGRKKRIAFDNAPRKTALGRPGSTLGGTGIGVSTRAELSPELKRHLLWLLGAEAQTSFLPAHEGQPAHRSAWQDKNVNALWNDFYRNTLETHEGAYVRPRYNGYIAFQAASSALLRQAIGEGMAASAAIDRLNDLHIQHRPVAGGER